MRGLSGFSDVLPFQLADACAERSEFAHGGESCRIAEYWSPIQVGAESVGDTAHREAVVGGVDEIRPDLADELTSTRPEGGSSMTAST
jgi:hypothetical protein